MIRTALIALLISHSAFAQSSKLYTEVSGSGPVTVIFESGMAGTHDEWDSYVDTLKHVARVFTYDRAGIGRSDSTSNPRTIPQMVEELRAELRRQNISPPYVLVGHSMGSYISRYFTELYPEEVQALILLDPSPNRLYDEYSEKEMNDFIRFGNETMSHSTKGEIAEWQAYLSNRIYVENAVAPDSIPVVIFSATQWDFYNYHEDFMNGNPQSKHVRLEASHAIHKERFHDILPYITNFILPI